MYALWLTTVILSMGMHTMDFKEATDLLFQPVDHAELAKSLEVSVATIRQARLKPAAKAHRSAPKDWPFAVIRLAEQRIMRDRQLIDLVRKNATAP